MKTYRKYPSRTRSTKNTSTYSLEFTAIVVAFALGLLLDGIVAGVILALIVIIGYASWKVYQQLRHVAASEEWFQNGKGIENINYMTPLQFEEFVAKLYSRLGYQTHLTPRTGDDGVDVLAIKDNEIYAIQVKKTAKPVGSPVIQTLYGSMGHAGARYGICVASAGFTSEAARFAFGKNIALVDKAKLGQMLKQATS